MGRAQLPYRAVKRSRADGRLVVVQAVERPKFIGGVVEGIQKAYSAHPLPHDGAPSGKHALRTRGVSELGGRGTAEEWAKGWLAVVSEWRVSGGAERTWWKGD